MHLVVIETTDHQNFHFGLFCIPFNHPQSISKFAVFFNHPLALPIFLTTWWQKKKYDMYS